MNNRAHGNDTRPNAGTVPNRVEQARRGAPAGVALDDLATDAWFTRGDVCFMRMLALEGQRRARAYVHLHVTGPLS